MNYKIFIIIKDYKEINISTEKCVAKEVFSILNSQG